MADVVEPSAATVDVEGLERALADLWTDPSGGAMRGAHLIRARMANLIVTTASGAGSSEIEAEFADLVEEYPARLIEIELDRRGAATRLDASVAAVCYPGAGGSRICSEQVKLQASGDAIRRVTSLVRQLLVGDLPTAMWWSATTAPDASDALFAELRQVAGHVVVDSSTWTSGEETLRRVVDWPAVVSEGAVSDVAWARLGTLRTLLAQSLSPVTSPQAIESLHEVIVEHAPEGLSEAGLLLGWLSSALSWQAASGLSFAVDGVRHARCDSSGGPVRLELRERDAAKGRIAQVRVAWGVGDPGSALAILAIEGHRLALGRGTAAPRVVARPEQGRGALVARELARRGTDSQFRNALAGLRGLLDRPAA